MSEMMPTFGGRTLEEVNNESGQDEYTKVYPNAVVDKDKAEVMAYASKLEEERVVDAANDAIMFAGLVAGDSEINKDDAGVGEAIKRRVEKHGVHSYGELRDESIKEAQQAREHADLAAQGAADQYEKTQHDNQTVIGQAEVLKSGGSIPELDEAIKEDRRNRIQV